MQKLRRNKVEKRFVHSSHYKIGKSIVKIKVDLKLKIVLLNWKDIIYRFQHLNWCAQNKNSTYWHHRWSFQYFDYQNIKMATIMSIIMCHILPSVILIPFYSILRKESRGLGGWLSCLHSQSRRKCSGSFWIQLCLHSTAHVLERPSLHRL